MVSLLGVLHTSAIGRQISVELLGHGIEHVVFHLGLQALQYFLRQAGAVARALVFFAELLVHGGADGAVFVVELGVDLLEQRIGIVVEKSAEALVSGFFRIHGPNIELGRERRKIGLRARLLGGRQFFDGRLVPQLVHREPAARVAPAHAVSAAFGIFANVVEQVCPATRAAQVDCCRAPVADFRKRFIREGVAGASAAIRRQHCLVHLFELVAPAVNVEVGRIVRVGIELGRGGRGAFSAGAGFRAGAGRAAFEQQRKQNQKSKPASERARGAVVFGFLRCFVHRASIRSVPS